MAEASSATTMGVDSAPRVQRRTTMHQHPTSHDGVRFLVVRSEKPD